MLPIMEVGEAGLHVLCPPPGSSTTKVSARRSDIDELPGYFYGAMRSVSASTSADRVRCSRFLISAIL